MSMLANDPNSAPRPDDSPASFENLLDHEYDGIREYDNPVPGWWHWLFWGSVVFGVLYYFYYTFSPISSTLDGNWEKAQAAAYEKIFGELGELEPDEATMLSLMGNDKMMAVAKGMFVLHCSQCHAKDGGGINGVNMTDDHYKNVTKLDDFIMVLNKGANNGAMPAWENRLSQNERILLASYAASLRGTTPAAGIAAEGNVLPPWPPVVRTETPASSE